MADFLLKRKEQVIALLFIITFAVSLVGDLFSSYKGQYIILSFWIVAAVIKLIYTRQKVNGKLYGLFKLITFPKIILFLYSLFLFAAGISNPDYFSTNATLLIPTAGIISTIYLFAEKSFKYICYSFVLSFIILWILKIYEYGLLTCLEAFFKNQLITGAATQWSPFEVHDLTFAAGYFLIFFLFEYKTTEKKDRLLRNVILIIAVLLIYLGYKRIQMLAFIGVMIYILLRYVIKDKYKSFLINTVYYIIMVSCIIYIVLILSGLFFNILDYIHVNTMGRVYYFKFIKDICELSPSFLGIGINNVSKYMLDVYGYLNVGGVHNDILKMYAEIGFFGFLAWLVYYLRVIPIYLNKHFNMRTVELFLIFCIFNYIIYTTDNIENYYIASFIYIFIPVWYAAYGCKSRSRISDEQGQADVNNE